ncbi:FmdB family zinc ribbon protein [Micromonospora sp. NPDC049004]|uniref:FmdB family zinc ribbon protein n=1 Tax=Micromonospora sp. NPDC049004 TaxID=3154348 RepID=UPI0033EFEDFC
MPTGRAQIPEENVPTYQYACTACGHQLEAVQSFSDEPLTECPACQGRLRKVFNSVGIVFKGSGFYRTDSRASGSETSAGGTPSKPAKSESSSSSSSSGGDSGSSSSSSSSGSSSGGSSSGSSSGGSSSGGSGGGKAPAASSAS